MLIGKKMAAPATQTEIPLNQPPPPDHPHQKPKPPDESQAHRQKTGSDGQPAQKTRKPPEKKEGPPVPIAFRKNPTQTFTSENVYFFPEDIDFLETYIDFTFDNAPKKAGDTPYSREEIQARIMKAACDMLRRDRAYSISKKNQK